MELLFGTHTVSSTLGQRGDAVLDEINNMNNNDLPISENRNEHKRLHSVEEASHQLPGLGGNMPPALTEALSSVLSALTLQLPTNILVFSVHIILKCSEFEFSSWINSGTISRKMTMNCPESNFVNSKPTLTSQNFTIFYTFGKTFARMTNIKEKPDITELRSNYPKLNV